MRKARFRQIKASAGSGKTYNLIREYMSLIARCAYDQARGKGACVSAGEELATYGMNEILAITFTNAAAGEMRGRVIAELKKAALGEDGANADFPPKLAALWLDKIIRELRCLNIRTIDSLMNNIARASALELGLNPDFRPEYAGGKALEPYLESFMNEARTNEAMARLLKDACAALIDYKSESFLPKNSVVNGVTSLLDDALRGEFDNLPDRETIQRKLNELTNDFIANAKDFLDKCDSSGMDWHGSSRNSVEKLSKGAFTADIPACLQGDITKLAKKNAVIPAEVEKSYPSFIKDTERYYELAPILKDALLRQPLAKISALVAGAFKERLDMEAAVPAALIPHKANEVLHADNGVSDAVCRLGTRLSHILIDEFQDTGDDQWEALRPLALEALSRGGAFAYVGDVKQSIYGFRNGNPRLFTGVIEDMELRAVADGGETDLLDENWRSGANIIDFNNRLFGIFEDKDSAKKVLRAMLHSQPETFQDESAGLLADNYKDCAQKPSPKERPAGAVRGVPIPYSGDSAARDEAIVDELARTVNDIKSRRGNWSGICVLARSNPQAAAAAEKLASLNIPVITENSLDLQDNPLVAQTLAILTFLANPVDDVAFWSVLNGAVFLEHPEVASALDRNALNDWAAKRRDEPLFRAFQRDFPEIWKKIFQPFYTILTRDEESSKNGALLAAPYDIVMEWRRRMDIERRFPSDEIFSRSFLEAVYTAEQNDYRTLPEFLEFWAEKGADAKAPMPAHMDAVRIMTIHKAKGLAAPVVIVPWTKYPTDPKSEIRSMNIDGLVIPYNAGLKSIGKPFYKKRGAILAENINLLYVAFTRAEEELWFFVPEKEDAKEKKNREKGENKEHGKETSAGGLEEALREAGFSLPLSIGELEKKSPDKTAKKPEEPSGPAPEPEDGTPSQTEIFNDDWRPMDWMPSLRVARKPAGEEGFSASARGEFLHYCMERMKFDGDPREDAENALQAGFANCEDAPPDKAELRSSLLEPLLWFRSIPQAPEWLKEGIFEQSLINEDGEVLRMDLLAPSESGYIIIDLKTGDEYPEHREQIETYIRLLKKIYPGKEIGGKLVYVDKQIIVAV